MVQSTMKPALKREGVYRIAAKYSNKRVFHHWFHEGCRITLWKGLMPQRAHDQGAFNATLRWRIWCHLAKLHVCESRKAFECLEVIRYVVLRDEPIFTHFQIWNRFVSMNPTPFKRSPIQIGRSSGNGPLVVDCNCAPKNQNPLQTGHFFYSQPVLFIATHL